MALHIFVNIGLGDGLVPKSMLTYKSIGQLRENFSKTGSKI